MARVVQFVAVAAGMTGFCVLVGAGLALLDIARERRQTRLFNELREVARERRDARRQTAGAMYRNLP